MVLYHLYRLLADIFPASWPFLLYQSKQNSPHEKHKHKYKQRGRPPHHTFFQDAKPEGKAEIECGKTARSEKL